MDYRLTIVNEDCIVQLNDTVNVKGKVIWIDECSLQLNAEKTVAQDTTTLAKLLYKSFGQPFIEIKQTRGRKTFFRTTWTGNLHVTINEGCFLKEK
jgi:hypothetical protein